MINTLFGLQFMFTEDHTNLEVSQLITFIIRGVVFFERFYKTLEKYHTF